MGRLVNHVDRAVVNIAGPDVIVSVVDNIGMPISGINVAYGNSGTIGTFDADTLITLKPGLEAKGEELVKSLREKLPELFPGSTFSFLPADIVTQILNFGLPAPIDVQVVGNDQEGNRALAAKLLKRISMVTGVADARIQQPADEPTIKVDVDRLQADRLGVSEKDVATSLQITLAGSIQTNPTFWLNPKNGVSYPVVTQTPQYWMKSLDDLARVPALAGQVVADLAPSPDHPGDQRRRGLALCRPAGDRHLRHEHRARSRRRLRRRPPHHRRAHSPSGRAARRSFCAGRRKP